MLIGLIAMVSSAGCSQTAGLSEHPLEGRRVALVTQLPDAPFADFDMTILDRVGAERPVPIHNKKDNQTDAVLDAVFDKKEVRARQTPAHVLLDSVLADQPMNAAIMKLTEMHGAQALRFDPVISTDEADYIFKIEIEDYGIGSDGWNAPLYYEIMAGLSLVNKQTGQVLWKDQLLSLEPVVKALLDAGIPPNHTASPAALSKTNYYEMAAIVKGLANYTAQQLIAPLQEAFARSVKREQAHLE